MNKKYSCLLVLLVLFSGIIPTIFLTPRNTQRITPIELTVLDSKTYAIGAIDTSGTTYDVVVTGDICYVADDTGGLQCIDITDPTNPTIIGYFNGSVAGTIQYLEIQGDTLYCSNTTHLLSLNVSDPTNPIPLDIIDPFGSVCRNLEAVGDILYMALSSMGFGAYNISDPSNIVELDTVTTSNLTFDISIYGDVLVLLDSKNIGLYNISDPTNLPSTALSTIPNPNPASHTTNGELTLAGNIAYVVSGGTGANMDFFRTINITDCRNPQVLQTLILDENAYGIALDGDLAYVANYNDDLKCYNIANPTDITEISQATHLGQAWHVATAGEVAYVAAMTAGLRCIRVSTLTSLTYSNHDVGMTSMDRVTIEGDIAYCSSINQKYLTCVDISDPSNPQFLGGIGFADSSGIYDVEVRGEIAYAVVTQGALQYGLVCLNVSNPRHPEYITKTTLAGGSQTLDVAGDVAYIAAGNLLYSYSVLDPSNLVQLQGTNLDIQFWEIEVSGNYAYIAAFNDGLVVVDIQNPSNLAQVGQLAFPSAKGLAVVGDVCYVVNNSHLVSIDITEPSKPSYLGIYALGSIGNKVDISGDIAVVAIASAGVELVNISDPSNPTQIATQDHGSSNDARDIAISGDYAYIADGNDQLGLLEFRTSGADDDDLDGLSFLDELWVHGSNWTLDNTPTISDPPSYQTHLANTPVNITWVVTDPENFTGTYRVFTNSSSTTAYQPWSSGEAIVLQLDTSILGQTTYIIEYNNSIGLWGTNDTVTVYIYDDVPPTINNNAAASYYYNTTASFTWNLIDNYEGGVYQWISDQHPASPISPWTNDTDVVIDIDTNTIGTFEFYIEAYDNVSNFWSQSVYINITEDIPPISNNPANTTHLYDEVANFTWDLTDNAQGGYYRIWRNTTIDTDWTSWDNSTIITVTVPTNQLTTWFFRIEYNDSAGNHGEPNTVVRTILDTTSPWDNHPADNSTRVYSTYDITWRLYDNVVPGGEGYYRVTSNSSVSRDWTPWVHGAPIDISVDTTTVGAWWYRIEYNDSAGNPNTGTEEVIITIYDDVAPTATPPTPATYELNAAAHLVFRLDDNYAGGYFRITSNGTFSLPWTPWISGNELNYTIPTSEQGAWLYSINYNDSQGNPGTTFNVVITVKKPPSGGIPGFELGIVFLLFTLIAIAHELKRKDSRFI